MKHYSSDGKMMISESDAILAAKSTPSFYQKNWQKSDEEIAKMIKRAAKATKIQWEATNYGSFYVEDDVFEWAMSGQH